MNAKQIATDALERTRNKDHIQDGGMMLKRI